MEGVDRVGHIIVGINATVAGVSVGVFVGVGVVVCDVIIDALQIIVDKLFCVSIVVTF
jgi:hypothetical protein